ncbi:DUF6287 domain-containing protein [Streptococcus oricebi]|uniref:DUF6287 domain-containing protein n=1 Tax=Streptococcus oricebi TaxID=1547447 RepID=A0ABS5B664_9STRE|nr:DUF6287 domain-containing protein [Streptococcus oricebi]MBP2624323.1 hypothetical protein [Streptococcus oricebi]
MKKTTVSLLLLASLSMGLAACSQQAKDNPSKSSSQSTSASSKTSSSKASSSKASQSSSSASSESSASSNTNPREDQIRMQIAELAEGNFASVRGTWQNSQGQRLTFDEKGLVSDSQEFYGASLTDYGTASAGVYGGEGDGFLLEFIPAGVSLPSKEAFKDDSDPGRDRLWVGVGINSFEEQGSFYYRV